MKEINSAMQEYLKASVKEGLPRIFRVVRTEAKRLESKPLSK
jgi:hypothetical protein